MCCTDGFPSVYFTVIPFWLHPSELFFLLLVPGWCSVPTFRYLCLQREPRAQRVITPTHIMVGSENKDPEWWLALLLHHHCSKVGHIYWNHWLPSFKTICHCFQGFCHFYLWLSVWRSPLRVTKPVTVRHFHSLSLASGRTPLSLQHLYQIWQFLKLCP